MSSVETSGPKSRDPFEALLDEKEGGRLDGHLIHLATWSDVIRTDLRKALGREDSFLNQTLNALLDSGLGHKGRYVFKLHGREVEGQESYSANYVRVQCLLAEWITVYRSAAVYVDSHRDFSNPDGPDDIVFTPK
jgi:hypothetical protein